MFLEKVIIVVNLEKNFLPFMEPKSFYEKYNDNATGYD
jgi:hypothetical protein